MVVVLVLRVVRRGVMETPPKPWACLLASSRVSSSSSIV
jgi:hypothetical protein